MGFALGFIIGLVVGVSIRGFKIDIGDKFHFETPEKDKDE